jgi:hypothetical protein
MLCYCGHTEWAHKTNGLNYSACVDCWQYVRNTNHSKDVYHFYKEDNLRYLESLLDKRK